MTNNNYGNYGYDINHILTKSNQQEMHQVESYVLQLGDWLANLQEMTPDMEKFVDTSIEFLYGLVSE